MQAVFDKAAIGRFRARALRSGGAGADFLLQRAARDLAERLALVDRSFESAAIASGNAALVDPDMLGISRHAGLRFHADACRWDQRNEDDMAALACGHDLIISLLSLHEVEDVPGALVQMRRKLRPDGLFMGVMAGAGTLTELRECLLSAEAEVTGGASPRVHPFADVRAAGALLQRAGLALPVADQETVTVRYPDMLALMRDLRAMGAANALSDRSRKPLRRDVLMRTAALYRERFAGSDGRIPATFNFLFLSGWAPAASQQQPARRGSATVSLAQTLRRIDEDQ